MRHIGAVSQLLTAIAIVTLVAMTLWLRISTLARINTDLSTVRIQLIETEHKLKELSDALSARLDMLELNYGSLHAQTPQVKK
jgi:hypothetical protein